MYWPSLGSGYRMAEPITGVHLYHFAGRAARRERMAQMRELTARLYGGWEKDYRARNGRFARCKYLPLVALDGGNPGCSACRKEYGGQGWGW